MKNLSIFLGLIVVVLTGALISTNNKLNNQVELTEYQRDRADKYASKIFLLEQKYSNNDNNDKFKTPDAGQNKQGEKVVVEWISDPAEVKRLLGKLTYRDRLFEEGKEYKGYAYWDYEDGSGVKKCTIIAPEPAGDFDDYRLSILGHEIYHCYVGIFHN